MSVYFERVLGGRIFRPSGQGLAFSSGLAETGRTARQRQAATLLAVVLLLGLSAGPAIADHGGRPIGSLLACDRPVTPPRCTSVGNDRFHHVAFDPSLTDALADAVRRSMADDYDAPTRLRMIEDARPNALTDVIAYSADYGDIGAAAWVYCPSGARSGINASGHRWCTQQELHFNQNPRFAAFFDGEESLDHVACHELGHTVGLLHWGNPPQSDGPVAATCMNTNTPDGPSSLHADDIDHINRYRYAVTPMPERGLEVGSAPGTLLEATGTEPVTSLSGLVAGADAVVQARVVAVESGRLFGPAARPLRYAAVEVEIASLVAGALPPGSDRIVLEVPLFDGPGSLDALRTEMLGSERVLFLRSKERSARDAGLSLAEQRADAGAYRLVTFGAELIEVGGRVAVPDDDTDVLRPLAGERFTDAVDLLASMAGG